MWPKYRRISRRSHGSRAVVAVDPGTKVLLLNMNGANGGTTFVDSSSYARSVTATGSLETNTSIKKYGSAALNTNIVTNTITYLNSVDAPELSLGSKDFCIQAWIYYAAVPYNGLWSPCISAKATSPNNVEYVFGLIGQAAGTAFIGFYASTDGVNYDILRTTSSFTPTTSTWHHVAVTRRGSELRFFWDGTQVGATQTLLPTIFSGTSPWRCIGFNANSVSYNGRIDDLVITVDSPVYTSDFTPPTAEYV